MRQEPGRLVVSDTSKSSIRVEGLTPQLWPRVRAQVAEIENGAYEPARRTGIEDFDEVVADSRGVSLIACAGAKVAGFCVAGPLESFPAVNGTCSDSNWGRSNTLYTVDTTVAEAYRGQGVARLLKQRQLVAARAAGYSFVVGRVRIGFADAIWKISSDLGAVQIQHLENEYADGLMPNTCIYYRIPVPG